jgi:dTDP-4-amino-4,6-dideoxygalactose transaminase
LADLDVLTLPLAAEYGVHIYHLYVVRVPERDRILQALARRGIACGIHYPTPVHRQDAYRSLGLGPGSFSVAERCAGEILSLPMFPELTPAQIETVARELKAVLPLAKTPEARVA